MDDVCGAHSIGSGSHGTGRQKPDLESGFATTDHEGANDERGCGGFIRGSPFQHVVADVVCRTGADPGRRRRLRRDVLCRHAKDARDRNSHGAGGPDGQRCQTSYEERITHHGHWRFDWPGGGVRFDAADAQSFVRGRSNRQGHVRRCFPVLALDCFAGVLHPGAAGNKGRSAGGLAIRIGRTGRIRPMRPPIGPIRPMGRIGRRRKFMSKFLQDLRYGIRTMLKHPGFTLIAVMTLALGIGSSTAIFTVVDAAVIRGLPYRSPEQLYHMWERTPQKEFDQREFSYPDYQDYLQNRVCEIAAYTGGGTILNANGESERVFAPAVSANFFSVLGVDPIKGRAFQMGEDKQGGPRVAVLTYGLWQRRFGGDEAIVGKQLDLAGDSYTVIGVLPQSFQFAMRPADLFLPYQPTQNQLTRRGMHGTNLIARLKQIGRA